MTLKENFEADKTRIQNALADAEGTYAGALKEFTEKYDNYHMTLKDSDFETTISGSVTSGKTAPTTSSKAISDLFDLLFSF